jgi:hypothetical protein
MADGTFGYFGEPRIESGPLLLQMRRLTRVGHGSPHLGGLAVGIQRKSNRDEASHGRDLPPLLTLRTVPILTATQRRQYTAVLV